MKRKKWLVASGARDGESLTDAVLRARGIQNAAAFTGSSADILTDPFMLRDMDKAVARISAAMQNGEKIAVYGDYDVDGVTSVYILTIYLRSRGADCVFYIPDRAEEGYGINEAALDRLAAQGVKLLVSVDTGITAVEETEYAKKLGIETVITDHHECRGILPHAAAVVNPHRPDCESPCKTLAGVGVVFKLVCALEGRGFMPVLERYGDMVAIGTIADVMPVTGENRAIITYGLKMLETTQNEGLKAIIDLAGAAGRKMTASVVGFSIAPRLNAAGRVMNASRAVELLLEKSAENARAIASEICAQNAKRQQIENTINEQALLKIENDPAYLRQKILVLWDERWHNGIIGIVASRLSERFYKPVILASVENGVAKCSGRSIRGFNLYKAIEHCAPLIMKFGGHELAAGFSMDVQNAQAFREMINEYAEDRIDEADMVPLLDVDCEINMRDITYESAESLCELEPYGAGNPQPVFCLRAATVTDIQPVGNDNHLRLTVESGGRKIKAMYFGVRKENFEFLPGDKADIAFNIEINTFRGERTVQLVIRDAMLCGYDYNKTAKQFSLFDDLEKDGAVEAADAADMLPSRDDLAAVWRFLSQSASDGISSYSVDAFMRKLCAQFYEMPLSRVLVCLAVFAEYGLVQFSTDGDSLSIKPCSKNVKIDISDSAVLKRLKKAGG